MRRYGRQWVLWTAFLLGGCSTLNTQQDAAPVVESSPYDIQHQNTHVVKRGDTLYTIAWRYGLDYHEVARMNHLDSPDHIEVGQVLVLNTSKKPETSPKAEKAAKPFQPDEPIQSAKPVKPAEPIQSAHPVKPAEPIQSARPVKPVEPIQSAKSTPVDFSQEPLRWDWPVKGKILKQYGLQKKQANNGIDIAGNLGKPIHAAGRGEVVYAGSGLRGYGQVVIVKHDETYLSAYAHNQEILVKEGDKVALGQPIALMGKTDHQQVKLHFEIRKNGEPIDPLSLLPVKTASSKQRKHA